MNELIDNDRWDKTRNAIKVIFGVEMPSDMVMLDGGGSSSTMYKFKVRNKSYVLRMMGFDQSIKDRGIQVECAQYGGRLNIAPKCYYADAEHGIIIMDYINQVPMTKEVMLQQMPGLLSKLHYSEKVPKPFYDIFPYINDLIGEIIKITPSIKLRDYFKSIKEVMSILHNHRQIASCHNDLNSENVLYDGKQVYLVDFEAAGLEDPYFDLATVCQQNCLETEEEFAFLEQYLSKKPNILELSKLCLMKQVSYCYHAVHFFQHAYNAGMMEFNDDVPSFNKWSKGRKEGIYALDTTYDVMLYGMVVLNQSLDDMATSSFIDSMNAMK